jgi:cytoskeletal protein CcmA (bactofilin family)
MNFRRLLSRLKRPAKPVEPHVAAPSIIAADVDIDGDLHSTGELQIDGNVHGDVRAQVAVIDVNAVVHGGVVADEVVVHGHVVGPIRGIHVHIFGAAQVEGGVISSTLSIEKGAWVAGDLRHSGDPLSESAYTYLAGNTARREWPQAADPTTARPLYPRRKAAG